MRQVKVGSTDVSVYLNIVDSSDGTPETGVTSATAGLSLQYVRNQAAAANISAGALSNLAAADSAHTDGGIYHVGDGVYRVDVRDAAFAAGVDTVEIIGTATGMVVLRETVQLVGYNPRTELTTAVLARIDENISAAKTLTAAAIQSIWDALTAALTTVGSIGKLLVDGIADTYQAKVEVVDDNVGAADRYIISWFKNGEPISAGVTLATIQVVKSSDGTDLIASSAMTIVAGTSNYYYSATGAERLVSGESYVAVLTATIDSAVRSWRQPVGIDS